MLHNFYQGFRVIVKFFRSSANFEDLFRFSGRIVAPALHTRLHAKFHTLSRDKLLALANWRVTLRYTYSITENRLPGKGREFVMP